MRPQSSNEANSSIELRGKPRWLYHILVCIALVVALIGLRIAYKETFAETTSGFWLIRLSSKEQSYEYEDPLENVSNLSVALVSGTVVTLPSTNDSSALEDIPAIDEEEGRSKDEGTINELTRQCPHWSSSFAQTFAGECQYWLQGLRRWKENANRSKEIAFHCDGGSCNGWGDQVTGMVTAFARAMTTNAHFRISHRLDMKKMFSPCLFKDVPYAFSDSLPYSMNASNVCSLKFHVERDCPKVMRLNCDKAVLIQPNRLCYSPSMCKEIARTVKAIGTRNVVGCAMRMMFEPSEWLRRQQVEFRFANNETRSMTLTEAEKFLTENLVFTIHIRTGDRSLFNSTDSYNQMQKHRLISALRCASTVESHLLSKTNRYHTVPTRPMWLFSSDSSTMKRLAQQLVPDRVVVFNNKPKHVQSLKGTEDVSTHIEWLLMGLGKAFFMNPMTYLHGLRRYSSFSITAASMHLMDRIYDIDTCTVNRIEFDGNWAGMNLPVCGGGPNQPSLPQPHLRPLMAKKLAFPHAWVKDGSIRTGNSPGGV